MQAGLDFVKHGVRSGDLEQSITSLQSHDHGSGFQTIELVPPRRPMPINPNWRYRKLEGCPLNHAGTALNGLDGQRTRLRSDNTKLPLSVPVVFDRFRRNYSSRFSARSMTQNTAPAGSATTAIRPNGTSKAGESTEPPSVGIRSSAASQSSTAR